MTPLNELAQRTLGDGSQTSITLFWDGADQFVVEAVNANGSTSAEVDAADAHEAFMHPFSREEWLSYPEARGGNAQRPLTDNEKLLAEMLRRAEVESDAN